MSSELSTVFSPSVITLQPQLHIPPPPGQELAETTQPIQVVPTGGENELEAIELACRCCQCIFGDNNDCAYCCDSTCSDIISWFTSCFKDLCCECNWDCCCEFCGCGDGCDCGTCDCSTCDCGGCDCGGSDCGGGGCDCGGCDCGGC